MIVGLGGWPDPIPAGSPSRSRSDCLPLAHRSQRPTVGVVRAGLQLVLRQRVGCDPDSHQGQKHLGSWSGG